MSQGPVPPRYPPQQPQFPQQQPQGYPQAGDQGSLISVPGQAEVVQPVSYFTPTGVGGGGVWNYGGILVMHKQAQLPPQCIKCCAPAEGKPLKRKLTWHPGWVYLLILPGLLFYAIVAMSIQEKATISVGLCGKHRSRRRMHLWIAWLIFFASIAFFFIAANVPGREMPAYYALCGTLGLLISATYALVIARLVTPHKIDPQYVWLNGVSREFAGQFPAMTQ
jgi:hypothetical protein